jgi:hypothetical protein
MPTLWPFRRTTQLSYVAAFYYSDNFTGHVGLTTYAVFMRVWRIRITRSNKSFVMDNE